MAFFVLEKESGGSLRLPIGGVFETREEALAALSTAVGAREASVTGQVFVADLDAAVPVLVMATPPAAEPPVDDDTRVEAPAVEDAPSDELAEAPIAEELDVDGEVEALGEDVDIDGVAPSTALEEDVPALGAETAAGSLAEALKRAATSLEDEGITAPESISAEDFSFEADVLPGQADDEAPETAAESTLAGVAGVGVAEPMSASEAEETEVSEAPAEWPWANVEAFTGTTEEDEAEDESESESATPAGESDETDTLITSAPPVGEEAYMPRPVILGDYADLADDAAVTAEVEDAAVVRTETPGEGQSDEISVVSPTAAGEDIGQDIAPEMAYEPTGELDLSEYTCNDCVYSNTCPKVGEVTPADCGTFQWRSS